jgi:hypothetical protein
MRGPPVICVRASFECYRDLPALHEVLFHHTGRADRPAHAGYADRPAHAGYADRPGQPHSRHGPEPAHALLTRVVQDLFAAGTAAGTFDVADLETTAMLCHASMFAFDQVSAAAAARTAPASSGPRSNCSGAPRA